MVSRQEAFLKKLMATFRVEAAEHQKTILAGLADLEWRQDSERHPEILESIFREAHSLKGAARAVNWGEIEILCQALENVFAALKNDALQRVPALYDLLYEAMDVLGLLLASDSPDSQPLQPSRVSQMIAKLDEAATGRLEEPDKAEDRRSLEDAQDEEIAEQAPALPGLSVSGTLILSEVPGPAETTVRIPTERLNRLFQQTEELFVFKGNIRARHAELQELERKLLEATLEGNRTSAEFRKVHQALEHKEERGLDDFAHLFFPKLLNVLEENEKRLSLLKQSLKSVTRALQQNSYEFSGMIDHLLEDMKMTLFLPVSSLLDMYPHVVRRLARECGKEMELTVKGGGIEIDRRILEELKDPLMHLLRNAVDHGIETPEKRLEKGKAASGRIHLHISAKESGKVEILLEDDGAGISRKDVREAALRNGLLSREEADKLTGENELKLIFKSGLSTVPILTDLSGRGLGLAIVQEKVEKLGGSIAADSLPDQGTTIRILLPRILATFRGILVEAGRQLFVLPTGNVERVARIRRSEIKTAENRETIRMYEKTLSFVSLGPVLGLPRAVASDQKREDVEVAILSSAGTRLVFGLDKILSEQEFLLKPLGGQLVRVRNIAGATVLGTGEVVPVLNVADLIKSAIRQQELESPAGLAPEQEGPAESERMTVLVVEDSITSRTLIRNILEFAGYRVLTAVDGIDALTVLRTEPFDLVISDVEMPRMNGFDLTARIRADKKLADLPVILVTALESREDKERGIDVGANAYIVKSRFDQSNLLDVIKRVA
ncbi:MAG: Gliding motility regulatory protein [Syntrophus sp. PtaU1.Bin208]|nr:MAG: Gliding motility regulatory protein [Syntrophus sp. PtaU1.Bin208]